MTRKSISSGSPFEDKMGYTRAVVQGNWCFVSGITGYDYSTMSLAEGIAAQAEMCIKTLKSVLAEADFDMSDIVQVRHYVKNRNDVEALVPVLGTHFGTIKPAATMIMAELMQPEMLYEIEVTAMKANT